jgi:ABC-2 type transport system permease protein
VLRLQSWYGAPEATPILDLIFGLVAYFLPLFILITFIWAFASFPIISEKVNGNIECLLATPLCPRELWIGKGLAVFLPGYVISLIASCIVLLVMNFAVVLPGWETFVLPGAALVNGLIINPLLFFGILSFIVLFSLANNPDVAIAPSFLIGFGLMIGIPVGLMTGIFDINSWVFVLWYLAGTVVVWLIVLYLTRLLKSQTIVLSSKGS